jgi:subtilisin family serine protease
MKKNKFPFRYYAFLILMLLVGILLWLLFFNLVHINNLKNNSIINNALTEEHYWQQDYLPKQVGIIKPIDNTKIINDSLNQRRIVSNLVNIAIKNTSNSIAQFASELKQRYPSNDYKIVYIDSIINRLQVDLPENERENFKKEVKVKLNNYKLLVWDETIFDHVKNFNDPKLFDNNTNWYLKSINIDKAWNQTTGNKNIIIAVIDNGFVLNHPELKDKYIKPFNIIDKTTNVNPNKENHGTHVTSTIIAKGNNNQGLVGICPDCSFMPIKVEDQNG